MKFTTSLLATLLATPLLTAGCASTHGSDFDVKSVSAIKLGQTTTSQTLAALGEPYSRNINTDGSENWLYQRINTKVSVGASAFIPVVGGLMDNGGSTKVENKQLHLVFENDLLKTCKLVLQNNKAKGSTLSGFGSTQAVTGGTRKETLCGN